MHMNTSEHTSIGSYYMHASIFGLDQSFIFGLLRTPARKGKMFKVYRWMIWFSALDKRSSAEPAQVWFALTSCMHEKETTAKCWKSRSVVFAIQQ